MRSILGLLLVLCFPILAQAQLTASISPLMWPICQGSCTQLNVQVTGGVPPYTYYWTPPAGLSSTTIPNPVACPTSSTTYTCVVTDAAMAQATVNITVQVAPTPSATITGQPSLTLCPGGCLYLNATVLGGTPAYSYQWSNGSTAMPNMVCAPGTYTLTVVDMNGCATVATANVVQGTSSFTAGITATPGTVLCPGSTITLSSSANPSGNYTYAWNNGVVTQNTMVTNPGLYSVTISDINGCSQSASLNITSLSTCSPPSYRYTTNITTTSARLNWGQAQCATSFQFRYKKGLNGAWYYTTASGTASSVLITGLQNNQTYYWSMRKYCSGGAVSSWSSDVSFTTPVILSPFQVGAEPEVGLSLYPNPNPGAFTLEYPLAQAGTVTFQVLDLNGKRVSKGELYGEEGLNVWNFQVGDLPNGLYLLQLESGEGPQVLKFDVSR